MVGRVKEINAKLMERQGVWPPESPSHIHYPYPRRIGQVFGCILISNLLIGSWGGRGEC